MRQPIKKTLILIPLHNLFQQKKDRTEINESLSKKIKELNEKLYEKYGAEQLIEFAFLISKEDQEKSIVTVDPECYASDPHDLNSALNSVLSSNLFNVSKTEDIKLITFSEENPEFSKDCIEKNLGQDYENIVIMASNKKLRKAAKESMGKDVLDIKIHHPTQFDRDDYKAIKNKLKTLKEQNKLDFEEVTVWLDIDGTAHPWSISYRHKETFINPKILKLDILLNSYFEKTKITYKVLTKRPIPPDINILASTQNEEETFETAIKRLKTEAEHRLEKTSDPVGISKIKKTINDLSESYTSTLRVILLLEKTLKITISKEERYFGKYNGQKASVIKGDCSEKKNKLGIYAEDEPEEIKPAEELGHFFKTDTSYKTDFHLIRAYNGGDLSPGDYNKLFENIVNYVNSQRTTNEENSSNNNKFGFWKPAELEIESKSDQITENQGLKQQLN